MEANIEIITNRVPRCFIGGDELTSAELKDFDWMDEETRLNELFFRYLGHCYSMSEFMRSPIPGWDGYLSDSFFSGILIKVDPDMAVVTCGRYFSKSNY